MFQKSYQLTKKQKMRMKLSVKVIIEIMTIPMMRKKL